MTTFLKHTVSSDHDHGTAARTRKKISESKKKKIHDQRRCQILKSCPTIETRTITCQCDGCTLHLVMIPRKERWRGTRTFHILTMLTGQLAYLVFYAERIIFLFLFLCAYNVLPPLGGRSLTPRHQ